MMTDREMERNREIAPSRRRLGKFVSFSLFALLVFQGCSKPDAPKPGKPKEVHLFIWAEYISKDVLKDFEKKTGRLDVVYRPALAEYRGVSFIQLELEDWCWTRFSSEP